MVKGVQCSVLTLACLMALGVSPGLLTGCARGGESARAREARIEKALKLIDNGRKLEAQGSPLLALERYNRAARAYSSPAAYFEMGRLFEALGKPQEAGAAYQKALVLAPDYQEARFAMLALGFTPPGHTPTPEDVARAKSWAAVRQVPVIATADGVTTPGGISEEAAALERERLKAQAAAERVPTQAEVQAVLFAAPASRTEPGLGELGYTSDQDIMLGSYPYHYHKAQQFQQRQQYDRAAEEYERALAADPTRLEPRLDLGDMMMRLERYPRARIYFERAMEDFPDSPRPYLKMGNYYLAINQPERARDYFRLATEKDPLYAEAYNNLAVMAMRDKNYTEAARLLDELIKLDPNYANAYFNRGIIASDVEKDTALALSLFRKYIELGGARAAEVQGWINELENPER